MTQKKPMTGCVMGCAEKTGVLIPPLTISDQELGQALDILEQAIDTAGKGL